MTVWSADTFLVKPRAAPPSVPDSRVYATHVQLAAAPRLLAAARPRGVKRLGLMYERRVIDVLSAIYGSRFVPSPSILYTRHGRMHRAIPDGLLYLNGVAIITEVKLAHTEAVWEQLMERYRPLVRLL